mmetsp:Transcript_4975/g.12214  ORF Transcript_4975/g.12214 Transcript_4975/m.12214 type:complete len:127 (-) Transcript_4975:344-724(-)|eukprot:CAMPEP_0202864446 /NCGR_PEP_ID=MMETSP1391-20130828/4679_1 /ASSEMBLY_ACC=CAM_ASM_000867 /TAXON_ID=1034604 /ORGANISM="Chlamydomonas leiostraca, Strain SAG 11-49" /LENGTH=126 /DNA_ID=CAMNT_0049544185 /DNA_START=71 /DNA_END=451 /DNA_ORIENTATION=+
MQALRKVVSNAVPMGTRAMAGGPSVSAEARWAQYFPKAKAETPTETAKNVRKEMIGFLLLGPASAALMVYDLIFGLENHEPHPIPPYPWMRIRRLPGMPWGEDGLLEFNPLVAKEWPPAEGLPAKH